jgi:hypothetical protein
VLPAGAPQVIGAGSVANTGAAAPSSGAGPGFGAAASNAPTLLVPPANAAAAAANRPASATPVPPR